MYLRSGVFIYFPFKLKVLILKFENSIKQFAGIAICFLRISFKIEMQFDLK